MAHPCLSIAITLSRRLGPTIRMETSFENLYQTLRPELTAYLCRLVVRPHVAEELAQTAFMRLLERGKATPDGIEGLRAWLFRVATNLAIDELRRHATWRENMVFDLREAAESNPEFMAQAEEMIGTPETKTVAREHLSACFACALRNLPERKAAAFLLKEVHDFTLAEIGGMLDASEGQAKNWLQEARAYMHNRYNDTCALMAKQGVCYQCVELDGYFRAGAGNPLPAGYDNVDARLDILKRTRATPWGKWHTRLFELLDDLI